MRFYITTPIYYLNDLPHIGHAYTTIAADAAARWYRMQGAEVVFLTGTDEHGQKVARSAEKAGKTPQEHVDSLVGRWTSLWSRLRVTYDDFIRTTEPRHIRAVQHSLQQLWEKGDIYASDYSGWYSTSAERFWAEDELVDGKCPDSGQPVEWVTERNYFFRMSHYQEALLQWIEANPDCIQPTFRKNEVLGFLKKPLADLCISRPKSRLSWGIPLPFDADYVTYVWFDALTNYITAVGHPDDPTRFARLWPADYHVIGKDILTFHTAYWFTMLLAQGITPPRCVYAHGWWLMAGRKMSKSLGNVMDPHLLIDAFGADALRYFLLREIPFGLDGEFSHEAMLTRFNADLANDLGNLAHRALSMSEKWREGLLAAPGPAEGSDAALTALAERATATFAENVPRLQFRDALEGLWELVRAGNKYIDSEAPWSLNRDGRVERLGVVLRNALEVCRIAASYLWCICPDKSTELLGKLGMAAPDLRPSFDVLPAGGKVQAGDPLFPRLLELPPVLQTISAPAPAPVPAPVPAPAVTPPPPTKESKEKKMEQTPAPVTEIEYDDFAKVKLRVGKVVTAERHPKADRLLVLKVDVGEAEPRTIVAGIATRYTPEELVGQQVVVVANLKPAKLRGIMSQGMLLAAGEAEVEGLLTLGREVKPGTVVR